MPKIGKPKIDMSSRRAFEKATGIKLPYKGKSKPKPTGRYGKRGPYRKKKKSNDFPSIFDFPPMKGWNKSEEWKW